MSDRSIKLSDLMSSGKKPKTKPYAKTYKEAKAACGKK